MTQLRSERGAHFLQVAAYLVIVIAGLKAAAGVIGQILLAALIAIALIRPIRHLQRVGVPQALAVPIVLALATTAIAMVAVVVGASTVQFTEQLPQLEENASTTLKATLTDLRVPERAANAIVDTIDPGSLLQLVGDIATAVLGLMSDFVVLLLLVAFLLFEASALPAKLRAAFGGSVLDNYEAAIRQVHGYLSVKTAVSLLTGVLASVACYALDVDFPVLWGMVAFAFNFVPNIGSLIAALPPVLLTLIQEGKGIGAAVPVIVAYVAINAVIGYLLEPRLMGQRLGLSTLVVFLSLILWAWVFGPIGMLLSVPLTAIVKIMLEHTDDLRGVALLLGPSADEDVGSAPTSG